MLISTEGNEARPTGDKQMTKFDIAYISSHTLIPSVQFEGTLAQAKVFAEDHFGGQQKDGSIQINEASTFALYAEKRIDGRWVNY